MTLLITALAAIIAAAIWFAKPHFAKTYHIGALALMYAGAAIMWCVDGFACLAEGEAFIELADTAAMADDALLGLFVVILGLVIWAIVLIVKHRKAPAAA
ncbi:MAG: hypothetical protein IKD70_05905 [Eggerthellaceae bacterium]|nr:hypothetical protein [Eggerthellaceae bacterium]